MPRCYDPRMRSRTRAGSVSAKFTGRSGCALLHKSVAFPLEADTDHWIELSGSPEADPILLVTPDR